MHRLKPFFAWSALCLAGFVGAAYVVFDPLVTDLNNNREEYRSRADAVDKDFDKIFDISQGCLYGKTAEHSDAYPRQCDYRTMVEELGKIRSHSQNQSDEPVFSYIVTMADNAVYSVVFDDGHVSIREKG